MRRIHKKHFEAAKDTTTLRVPGREGKIRVFRAIVRRGNFAPICFVEQRDGVPQEKNDRRTEAVVVALDCVLETFGIIPPEPKAIAASDAQTEAERDAWKFIAGFALSKIPAHQAGSIPRMIDDLDRYVRAGDIDGIRRISAGG